MAVRAVNLRMTRCAVLVARCRLVVETGYARRFNLARLRCNGAVALQTELIDVVALEHFWIARSVRGVAACTTLNFQRRVFEHKRPLLIGVALHAGCVGAGVEPRLLQLEATVRVVAIAALHRSFKHPVMERLSELCLCFVVTGHA